MGRGPAALDERARELMHAQKERYAAPGVTTAPTGAVLESLCRVVAILLLFQAQECGAPTQCFMRYIYCTQSALTRMGDGEHRHDCRKAVGSARHDMPPLPSLPPPPCRRSCHSRPRHAVHVDMPAVPISPGPDHVQARKLFAGLIRRLGGSGTLGLGCTSARVSGDPNRAACYLRLANATSPLPLHLQALLAQAPSPPTTAIPAAPATPATTQAGQVEGPARVPIAA